MRRLPVYFVLDVSESMAGENVNYLEEGLNRIIRTMRQDPYCLETVHVSVIAFAGKARTIVPLVELAAFYSPKLPIGSGTSLGGALYHLMSEIDNSVVKTSELEKGDWKPIIYLLTDGKPTDLFAGAFEKWKKDYASRATLIAIALGKFADVNVLKRIANHTLVLEKTNDSDFKICFDWITDSVRSQSKSLGENNVDKLIEPQKDCPGFSMAKDSHDTHFADPDFVILTGRCSRNRLPYLMKYERNIHKINHKDFAIDTTNFKISGCYPLGEEYFEWSDEEGANLKINSSELIGYPSCPHCGNASAFAVCACGAIMCINGPGSTLCPWCLKEIVFQAGSADDEGFDISRALG